MYQRTYRDLNPLVKEENYNPIKITISIIVGLAILGLYGSYCINPLI